MARQKNTTELPTKTGLQTRKKQIPMLYTSPMVQALKSRTKTETRRLRNLNKVNKNPGKWTLSCPHPRYVQNLAGRGTGFWAAFYYHTKAGRVILEYAKCPYGQIGDVIWARETFTYVANSENFLYRADFEPNPPKKPEQFNVVWTWTPSIHMPKLAARIWLEITGISCERLQDISHKSALAEGIEIRDLEGTTTYRDYSVKRERFAYGTHFKPRDSYKTLWEKINGPGSWKKNPWVWVIKFKRISKQE